MDLLLTLFLLLSLQLSMPPAADATRFRNLGINFGQLGNDLPSPSVSIARILSLKAGAVKIYDANPAILSALSGTRLKVSIGLPNELITAISTNRSFADAWISTNLLPFQRNTRIRYLLVGNEVLSNTAIKPSWPHIVPAMNNLQASLKKYNLTGIKVGTTLAMDALQTSYPPSTGAFRADVAETVIRPMLRFLNRTRSYYFVDAYPYFAWAANRATIDLDYALFRGNSSTHYKDSGSGLTYTNLLDQQLDAVIFAMRRMGFHRVQLAIAETGWPNAGDVDEIGANVYNAAIYNRNLARRMAIQSPAGTPARPGVWMPVFLFALYNENQKPGPGTERHWGLLYPNGTAVYGIDLSGRKPDSAYPPQSLPPPPPTNNLPPPPPTTNLPPPTPPTNNKEGKVWCVLAKRNEAAANDPAVGAALNYACGQGNGTCDAIQPGGACFTPDNLTARASYAFNEYWQQFRYSGGTCSFNGLAVETSEDPSYGSCKFSSRTN